MSRNVKQAWNRLRSVMERLNVDTVDELAHETGISREVLNNIYQGRSGLSRDAAGKIHTRIPDISVSWLMTGDEARLPQTGRLPVFDKLPQSGSFKTPPRTGHITLPEELCRISDFALNSVFLDDPAPPNAVFILKKAGRRLQYGKLYIIEYNSLLLYRKVLRAHDEETVRLAAENSYDSPSELVISRGEITRGFMVTGLVVGLLNEGNNDTA